LAERIGLEWLDCLMLPEIIDNPDDPIVFASQHFDILQVKAQEKFGALQTNCELHEASVLLMGMAFHLARGIGADPESLAEHWIGTAKGHGAIE
jgi:uncharacterized protein